MASNPRAVSTTRRTPVQLVTVYVSVVFLLVGVLGFVPGVTANYGALMVAGHESGALLLGIFAVSVLHNVVHLLFGVVGLLLARSVTGATGYLVVGGVVYLALWLYGIVVDEASAANFVPLNTADNWLHLGLAVGLVLLGLVVGRLSRRGAGT